MKEEQLKILELLKEGKLTSGEALELLEALEQDTVSGSAAISEKEPESAPSAGSAPDLPSSSQTPVLNRDRNAKLFPAPKGQWLEVDLIGGGDIRITAWEREEISVSPEKYFWSIFKAHYKETAGGLKIFSVGGHSFDIAVPSEFNLKIRTAGGDIDINGVSGSIIGKTMGGDLTLSHLKGNLDLTSMGGDIHITDSELNGKVHTMGGDIVMTRVAGNITGSTMGGDVIRQ